MRTRSPLRTRARSILVAMMAAAMLMGSASAAFANVGDDDNGDDDNSIHTLSCILINAPGC